MDLEDLLRMQQLLDHLLLAALARGRVPLAIVRFMALHQLAPHHADPHPPIDANRITTKRSSAPLPGRTPVAGHSDIQVQPAQGMYRGVEQKEGPRQSRSGDLR